jgi:hypothetical protein
MTQPPPILDYAKRPRLLRRKWFRRLVLGPVLIGVVAVGLILGPELGERTRTAYYQYRCRTYTASPDQVIVDYDFITNTMNDRDSRMT